MDMCQPIVDAWNIALNAVTDLDYFLGDSCGDGSSTVVDDVVEAITGEDIFEVLALFGMDNSTVSADGAAAEWEALVDETDGVDITEIENFLAAIGLDITTATSAGFDIDTIVTTVNAAVTGEEFDHALIFADTVYNAMAHLGLDMSAISSDIIYIALTADGTFDHTDISQEDVIEFFEGFGIVTADLDQGLLLEALAGMGIDLIPSAKEMSDAIKEYLGITIKVNVIQAWLDANVVVGDIVLDKDTTIAFLQD